jgi:hypothetical protein
VNDRKERIPSPGAALLAFAAAVLVFHHAPTLAGHTAGDWIDLVTPFAVIGAAAAVLISLRPRAPVLAVALIATLLYVDGHGIHLSANSIGHEPVHGEAERVRHFWDEEWGHAEWHLGWIGLIAAFCLADRERRSPVARRIGVTIALMLGWTLFTSTVEGGTWWLELAGTATLGGWALLERRPLLLTCAGAFVLAAALIGAWAAWQGGVPQFSEVFSFV